MRKIVLCCVVLAASEARAQQEQDRDKSLCFATGGTAWDDAKPSPRCTCPRGKVNAITAGGVCDKWRPNCDKCVEAGVKGHVRVVTRERVVAPSCEALCKAQGAVARWDKDAPEESRCEPTDPEQYLSGKCAVVVKPAVQPTEEVLCRLACLTTSSGSVRWVASADRSERCQPVDPTKFVARPCGIVPKPAAPPPQIVRVEVPGKRPPLFHLGGELRFLGLQAEGFSAPLGVAPSVTLRITPAGRTEFLVAVGPFITGNGWDADGTPVGVGLVVGAYQGGRQFTPFGLEFDANWYAIDRTGEAYAVSFGGRAPVLRWRWMRQGECQASGGIGSAYLLPEEQAAFIWGLSGGCTTP